MRGNNLSGWVRLPNSSHPAIGARVFVRGVLGVIAVVDDGDDLQPFNIRYADDNFESHWPYVEDVRVDLSMHGDPT